MTVKRCAKSDLIKQAEVGQALLFRPSCYAIELLSILQGYFFYVRYS